MSDESRTAIALDYGGKNISVALSFRERKRLTISVHPDGTVTALAPIGRSVEAVEKHLYKRRSWIAKQLRYFRQYQPGPAKRYYVSGETWLYLGRQYRLRVNQSEENEVKLQGGYINVDVPKPSDPVAVAKALDRWYRIRAGSVFRTRLNHCCNGLLSSPDGVELRIRKMKTRWGSCSKSGVITLNLELIKAPTRCIDYVITHELCHLKIHDHRPAFYRLLNRYMPDWEKQKARLNKGGLV